MRVHTDWSTPAFGFEPVAPGVGPFPRMEFLKAWWDHRGSGDVMLAESGDGLLPLHCDGGVVRFLGEPDLTDYHTPLGPGAAGLVTELVSSLPGGTRVSFDSLPGEASEVMGRGLADAGLTAAPVRHEVSAVVSLPGSYEEHLTELTSKERHEIRRKRRRFAAALGEPALVRDGSVQAFEAFVAMHRAAPGSKGSFFDESMEAFFRSLLRGAGAVLDLLVASDGTPVAAAFGFEATDAYYLYNSSFEPSAGQVSPGVVLVDRLIEAAIAAGRRRLDFLKGAEAYKFRMGAVERPLFALEAEL